MKHRVVRLGQVVDINPSTKATGSADDLVAFLAMADLSEEGRVASVQQRPLADVQKGYTVFQTGDVLLAKITPCFENGKAAFVESLPTQVGFGSTEFHVLRPTGEVDPKFLFHLVWNPNFRRLGASRMTGSAGQRRVPVSFLADYEFLLPSLNEQQRIATILDKADILRRKRQEAIRLGDEFVSAVFMDMFNSPDRSSKWPQSSVADMVASIESGWSAPSSDLDLTEQDLAVLKVSAVSTGWFLPNEAKVVDRSMVDRPLVFPRRGDLLFSRANTRELVAACCLVEEDVENRFLPDKLWRITAEPKRATNEYLCYLFRHPAFRHELTRQATGTSGSMLNISQAKLLSTSAPMPPIALQEKFSKIVQRSLEGRRNSLRSLRDLESLKESLTAELLS